jgi:flagellar motor protein MotB
MGSIRMKNKHKLVVPVLILIFCTFITLGWSAGYQEEKLFDGNFYSPDDLIVKVDRHTREIRVIDNQIKALETDIDWLVLKINTIQDSGRHSSSEMKDSVTQKEELVQTLKKNKNRLEYLVQYYSSNLKSKKDTSLEDILKRKVLLKKKEPVSQKEASIRVQNFSSGKNPSDFDPIDMVQLQAAVDKAGLTDWVELIGSGGTCLKIETTLPILFSTGSARVAEEYKSFFKKLAEFLKPYDVKVQVNGYADTVPIHNKKYPSNFELAATRAANIVHQFVTYGLKPSIFKIESTGQYRVAAKGMSNQKTFERKAEVTVIFSG